MNAHYQNYSLLTDLTGSNEDLQLIINTVNEKYNNSFWRTMTDVLPASRSKKFSVIVEETGILVKASVVGSMSKKPLRSFEGGRAYEDSMHKIGHGFNFNQSDLNTIEELNLVNTDMAVEAAKKYVNRAQNLIAGFHSAWNGWIYQAISNQEVSVRNQSEGAASVVDLRTKSAHKLKAKGSAGWFVNGTTAVIVEDLQRMSKIADDGGLPADRVFVCSKTLYDKLSTNASILAGIKASMPWSTADTYISPRRVMQALSTVYDIPPIVKIDEISRIEVDGVPINDTADFNVDKISLIPMTKLFNMHNSVSDYMKDTNPATYKASTEGGLIGSIQLFSSDPINVLTNFESWSFPTFKNPDMIVSLDTSQASETGL